MKPLRWLGDTLKYVRTLPSAVQHHVGYELQLVQEGETPSDFKPMPAVGKGVEEIRIWDESGTYRVIYLARLEEAVYVLHAFQKKTQATALRDIALVQERLKQLLAQRPSKSRS